MITMTVVATVKPDKQEEFVQVMRSLRCAQKKRNGFGTPRLYKEVDNATGFGLICQWETQKGLDEYLHAKKFRVLLGAVKVHYRSTKEFLSAYSANISGGGISIRTQEPRPLKHAVRMRFTRPSVNHQFDCHGIVAWANPSPKKSFLPADMGTKFTDLAGEAKKLIEESVNKNTGPGASQRPFFQETVLPAGVAGTS